MALGRGRTWNHSTSLHSRICQKTSDFWFELWIEMYCYVPVLFVVWSFLRAPVAHSVGMVEGITCSRACNDGTAWYSKNVARFMRETWSPFKRCPGLGHRRWTGAPRYIQTLVVRNLSTYVKRIRFQVPKSQEFRSLGSSGSRSRLSMKFANLTYSNWHPLLPTLGSIAFCDVMCWQRIFK